MENGLRTTGIEAIGAAPWGTHFCQFYRAREDLVDTLVPYFKAGLENNEFCMWVTSEPLGVGEAREAMKSALPGIERYIEKGQIEIIPYSEWYTKGGSFESDRVLAGWVEKLELALAGGYDGLRLTGNTFWLERKDWDSFTDYEAKVDSVLGRYKMIALCTYSLERCGASEIIDVVGNHEFALIKRRGKWDLIESSARKEAKRALKDTRMDLNRAQAVAMTGSWRLNIKRNELIWSDEAYRIFGIPAGTRLTYEDFLAAVHPDDRAHVGAAWSAALGGKKYDVEHRIIAEGRTKWVREKAELDLDSGGNLIGGFGTVQDITERKQKEEELKKTQIALMESEERYRSLVEMSPEAIFIYRGNEVVFANPAAIRLFGASSQEKLMGMSPFDLFHSDYHPVLRERIRGLLKGESVPLIEGKARRLDGAQLCVEVVASPLMDRGEMAIQVLLRDITDRKEMEEALKESSWRFRTMADFTNDWEYWVSSRGNIIHMSPSSEKVTGYAPKDFIASPGLLEKIVHPDDRRAMGPHLADAGEDIPPLSADFRIIARSGEERWISHACQPVYSADGSYLGRRASNRDVTARKRMEDALRLSHEWLELAQKSAMAGFWDWNASSGKVTWSNEFIDLFGIAPGEEASLDNWLKTLHEEDRKTARSRIDMAIEKHAPLENEYRILHPVRGTRWIRSFANTFYDESGHLTHMCGICIDTTEIKRAEQARG